MALEQQALLFLGLLLPLLSQHMSSCPPLQERKVFPYPMFSLPCLCSLAAWGWIAQGLSQGIWACFVRLCTCSSSYLDFIKQIRIDNIGIVHAGFQADCNQWSQCLRLFTALTWAELFLKAAAALAFAVSHPAGQNLKALLCDKMNTKVLLLMQQKVADLAICPKFCKEWISI